MLDLRTWVSNSSLLRWITLPSVFCLLIMLKMWGEQDINILMNIYIIDRNIPGLRGNGEWIDAYRNVNSCVEPSCLLMKLATEDLHRISKALADPQRHVILQQLAMTGTLNCS